MSAKTYHIGCLNILAIDMHNNCRCSSKNAWYYLMVPLPNKKTGISRLYVHVTVLDSKTRQNPNKQCFTPASAKCDPQSFSNL